MGASRGPENLEIRLSERRSQQEEPALPTATAIFRVGEERSQRQTAAVNFRDKIINFDQITEWRKQLRLSGKKLVVTNGCFDLLHVGHVTYLENARNFGDALLIGVNGDAAVSGLKGPGRPVNSEADRALVLAALESVDVVSVFQERTATHFLTAAQPDIYVKGGDYTLETLNQDERRAVEAADGKILLVPFVPGKSTTGLLEKISRL
jgi:rfaE bifunctional protein nucleotidyltransferase chain/domain